MPSPAARFAALPATERRAYLEALGPDEAAQLRFNFDFWAHDHQRPPTDPDWRVWLLLAGRGVGKTLACTQYVRAAAESGRCRAISLVASTMDDGRKTLIERHRRAGP